MDTKSPLFLLLFTLSFLPFYALLWIIISSVIRALTGFSWRTSREYRGAAQLSWVRFSTVRIAGITFNNCLHIIRLDQGFLLKLTRIFLGGSRYIADGQLSDIRRSKTFLGDTRLELR